MADLSPLYNKIAITIDVKIQHYNAIVAISSKRLPLSAKIFHMVLIYPSPFKLRRCWLLHSSQSSTPCTLVGFDWFPPCRNSKFIGYKTLPIFQNRDALSTISASFESTLFWATIFILLLIAGSNLNDRWRNINSKACRMVDNGATQTGYKYYWLVARTRFDYATFWTLLPDYYCWATVTAFYYAARLGY